SSAASAPSAGSRARRRATRSSRPCVGSWGRTGSRRSAPGRAAKRKNRPDRTSATGIGRADSRVLPTMPITPHVTSAARRRLRPAALVLGSAALVLGAMTPATAATATTTATTTAARAVLPTTAPRGLVAGVPSASVLGAAGVSAVLPAARSAKKPARVKKPKLVKNGRRHHNVRISWPWVSGATRYVVQASPKKKFKKKTNIRVTRNNPRSRPAGGRVELTVPGLKNATTYRVRVRAIAPNGAKGRWSK